MVTLPLPSALDHNLLEYFIYQLKVRVYQCFLLLESKAGKVRTKLFNQSFICLPGEPLLSLLEDSFVVAQVDQVSLVNRGHERSLSE